MALLVFALTVALPRRRQNRSRYPLSRLRVRVGSLWPHASKPATVMAQAGVPFAPEALAVV